jgi:hypothetical protein
MVKNKSKNRPTQYKLNLNAVCRLAQSFANLLEAKDFGCKEGALIAACLSMASSDSKKLTLKEIAVLVYDFNKSNTEDDPIKRYLISHALLSARHISQVVISGRERKYNKPKIWSPFEMSVRPKQNIENEIELKGDLRNGYLAVNRVVGKRSGGFGPGFEANVLEEVKIMEIKNIKKIRVKKIGMIRCLYVYIN